MIGHYVDALPRYVEDRILTSKLGYAPNWTNPETGCRCLVGTACNLQFSRFVASEWSEWYDALAQRFGERVNIAIRNRILANRARRALLAPPALQQVEEGVTV